MPRHSSPSTTDGEKTRWRKAQELRRRARLSHRGRATLGLLAVASLGGIALAAGLPSESEMARVEGVAPVELPPAARKPASDAPAELLERLPVSRTALEMQAIVAPGVEVGSVGESGVSGRLFERVAYQGPGIRGPLRIEYTLDAELTRQVFRVLSQGRVQLGHVIVLEPGSGRVLAYASTNLEEFPPTRAYPAASLVKVITAAAALDAHPETAGLPCRFAGSPYRLTPARIDPPSRGNTISLRRALATSNNQCFAQLAVHAVGGGPLLEAIARFGWLSEPAPAHAAGTADAGQDRYDVGKLGCGLGRSRITPLHAAQLAAILAHGELVAPRWVDRVVDAEGRELPLPAVSAPRRVISPDLAAELRAMLVDTTTRGTARSAFRKRNGRPLLGPVHVAGKTGSLSGENPTGRYEWFIGVAPAEEPRIAVATLLVQGDLWWRNASQISAEVLRRTFCTGRTCRPENAERWLRAPAATALLAPSRADAVN